MHVVLISACEKRAIKRTRAVLDSYALRTGPSSWGTPITQEALKEVHAALKRSATRQTSVACYKNDGLRRMKLMWIVGAKTSFGSDGHFSCGTTKARERVVVIPDWVRVASMLAKAAGKIHDIGKASIRFQNKLRGQGPGADRVRHEWLSAKLIQAMRSNGRDWASAWKAVKTTEKDVTLGSRKFSGKDVCAVAGPIEAIDLLVLTHHKLLGTGKSDNLRAIPSCEAHVRDNVEDFKEEQYTPDGDIGDHIWKDYWTAQERLQRMSEGKTPNYWRGVSLFARAALIFADHTISAVNRIDPATPANPTGLSANTYRGVLNQTLDWHLDNVGSRACDLVAKMHGMALPGLAEESVESICQAAPSKYEWQNTAARALQKAVRSLPDESKGQIPVLVFNIAGTGSGKTRMNVRAACVLREGQSAPRLAIALNLRSLTLQTGHALRSQLKLDDDELATVIGDETVSKLFRSTHQADFVDADENAAEPSFICDGEEHALPDWLEPLFAESSNKQRLILSSPLLVSTIDYLVAAGEPGRQGHHVKAFLRVMSSDLVLDEIDGYDPLALVAVLRLVQVAAMAGRNVICSSATLALPVAHAVAAAFRSGVAMREAMQGQALGFLCAQIDDVLPPSVTLMGTETATGTQAFEADYRKRLDSIKLALVTRAPMRIATLQKLLEVSTTGWLNAVTQGCSSLHAGQGWLFNESGVTVSFGLVRVANIRTAITLARHLSTSLSCDELAVKIACYHANDFLLSRFNKEHRLDHLLSRGAGNAAIEADAETRQEVKRASARGCKSLMFIVVATPVEEIGRDHDFDWAVIEPSSAQSVVQTAGRVNRHRMQPVAVPNIAVLQFNLKHCKNIENGKDNEAAFIHPGLESIGDDGSTHATHDMTELFVWSETGQLTVDARLRFDHEVSRFSAFDDTSMTCSLNKFFGCQIGSIRSMFDNENFAAQLIGQTVYDASPLRSKGNWNQVFYFIELEGLAPVFRERLLDGNNVITLIPRSPSQRDRNDWLVSSFEDMLSMCAELDVSPMQGTSLVISRYSQATNSNMEVVLDESYGAYRITHRAGG